MSKKGFTLVELLVTISILAILSSIALISYGNVQKNTRDVKRKSDLATIQAALEQYHADQGVYPFGTDFLSRYVNSSLVEPTSIFFGDKIYLQLIPKDPSGSPDPRVIYFYKSFHIGSYGPIDCVGDDWNGNHPHYYCTHYCIYAKMENLQNFMEYENFPSACKWISDSREYRNYAVSNP